MEKKKKLSIEHYWLFLNLCLVLSLRILSEEIWQEILGRKTSTHLEKWPVFDASKTIENSFKLVVQVNGKMRDFFEAESGISEEDAKDLTLKRANVKKWVGDKHIEKTIYVPNRIINIITQS